MEFQLKSILIFLQAGVTDKWTSDSKHFILENFDTICNSPSQIYGPPLTLCPSSSWLHEYYTADAKAVVGSVGWGTCTRTVFCNNYTTTPAYWNNTIATGCPDNDITIFDVLTGSQTAVFSGHGKHVHSLVFSSDGTFLVSGSYDETIKLWDVQTGGVVKTFCGHTSIVLSVSISVDNTTIASGSVDRTICLWNIGTGECQVIKKHNDWVKTVSFSPTNTQLLLSASRDGTVRKWGTDGHQIGPPIPGSHVAFSPDGTQFVLCNESVVTIWNTDSGETVVEVHLTNAKPHYCCFSPDGGFIACAAGHTIYLWDITGPDPHLIKTLVGHTDEVTSLVFSSLPILISASVDDTIKFWEISTSSANPVVPHSAPIRAVSLQAKDGLAFSVDSAGVVRTWSILTGLCKKSFETQAKDIGVGDIQLLGDRLIIIGYKKDRKEICIWDAEQGEPQTVGKNLFTPRGLRISGDGSRVFCVDKFDIQAWSIQTGAYTGEIDMQSGDPYWLDPLWIDGSKVMVRCEGSSTLGWDFGIPGSTPIKISPTPTDRPHLDFIGTATQSTTDPIGIEDRITGAVVFQLCGRYAQPSATQWDGRYLIAGYGTGEVLILDFSDMLP